jgi:hypothetical protein
MRFAAAQPDLVESGSHSFLDLAAARARDVTSGSATLSKTLRS